MVGSLHSAPRARALWALPLDAGGRGGRPPPPGLPLVTAHASSAPRTAPASALMTESWIERTNASPYAGPENTASMFAMVKLPVAS